jgi:MFS transporter, SP family, arabinose:H+ symporter
MGIRIFIWALVSALAGFLFGFDTVVISGAEQTIQTLWGLSAAQHGLAIGAALYGTVIGALAGAWPADRYGRKPTLLFVGLLYCVSAAWSGLANDVVSFGIARFLGGLGIGISTVVAPMYITEIAPPAWRGRLTAMFQFNIVFGIVVAFASNALLADTGPNAWRWMVGVAAFPSLLYTLLCLTIPESQRWLDLRSVRAATRGADRVSSSDTTANPAGDDNGNGSEAAEPFFSARMRKPILLAVLVAFFNQLSGINAILYFAPRIFEMTGLGKEAALLQSVGIGVTNLLFTFLGLWLIDRLGRRTLLLIGSFGYIASLGLTAWAFHTEHYSIVPACIFGFIAAHAIGQGTVIWVFISEIFPTSHRAAGQALGSFTHWVFAALLTTFFPGMVAAFAPASVFLFFCGMMVLQLLWVVTLVPETKGVPLEDLEQQLAPRH